MNNKPGLSIIMPVYNHRELVKVMLDSILANSYDDWELLAVDDGSDRATVDMLEDYAAKDRRILIIKRDREPKGAPTCRNIGFEKAKGEYIVFFDSDDYVTPECLKTRVECISGRSDLDFMVFPSGVYDERGFHAGAHLSAFGYPIYKDDIASFARRWLPFVVWNNIYRRSSLRYFKIRWDEKLLSLQDADFNVATLVAGLRYDYARTAPNYGYRLSTNSSVSKKTFSEEHYRSHARSIRNMYEMVRGRYGHKYDRALFGGVCYMYNSLMTGSGVNQHLAAVLADSISDLDPGGSRILKRRAWLSKQMGRVLPSKVARQLPMLSFLISFRAMHRKKIKRISKLL